MRFIGRREGVPPALVERMEWAERITATNDRITLFVAFNYGGRAEIVDAARRLGNGGDEGDFARLLYAPEMNDPDLLIRTSGERRLSNFLLWQCAYSELVFSETLWPDFSRADLEAALGRPVRAVAYPVGRSIAREARIRDAIASAGYRIGLTNASGVNRVWPLAMRGVMPIDPFDVRRLSTDRSMSDAMFLTQVAVPQLAYIGKHD